MDFFRRRILLAPDTETGAGGGAATADGAAPVDPIPEKPEPIGEGFAPLGGHKIQRMPSAPRTEDGAEAGESDEIGETGAVGQVDEPNDEPITGSEPITGKPDKQAMAEQPSSTLSESDMADLRQVFSQTRIDAAKAKGPAALEMLLELARDELTPLVGRETRTEADEPKADEPKAETAKQPDPKAAKAQPKRDDKDDDIESAFADIAEDAIEEMKAVLGDEAFSKGVKPLIDARRVQKKYNEAIHTLVSRGHEWVENMVAGLVIDAFNDPAFGNQQKDDLSPQQQTARKTLLAEATLRMKQAQEKGVQMSPHRALRLARAVVSRIPAKQEAVRELQDQVQRRHRAAGAVPARGAGIPAGSGAARGDEAAMSAVSRKLAQLGIRE